VLSNGVTKTREEMWEATLLVCMFLHNIVEDDKAWAGPSGQDALAITRDLAWPSTGHEFASEVDLEGYRRELEHHPGVAEEELERDSDIEDGSDDLPARPQMAWYRNPALEATHPSYATLDNFDRMARKGCPLFDPSLITSFADRDTEDRLGARAVYNALWYRDRICECLADGIDDAAEKERLAEVRDRYLQADLEQNKMKAGKLAEACYGAELASILRRPGLGARRLRPNACLRWPPLLSNRQRTCDLCRQLRQGNTCSHHAAYARYYAAFMEHGEGILPLRILPLAP
jgi:hypothetical protein